MRQNILLAIFITITLNNCCKKQVIFIKNEGCPDQYQRLSEPYINPYKGTIYWGGPIAGYTRVFPEGRIFRHAIPCANNKYKISFTKIDYKTAGEYSLNTFDFCTNKLVKLVDGAITNYGWTSRDWLIFQGSDLGLWKVKSNGDSLSKIRAEGGTFNSSISPNGDKILFNGWYLLDENGATIKNYTIRKEINYGWWDNEIIIVPKNGIVFKFNVLTENEEVIPLPNNFTPNPGLSNSYNKDLNVFYGTVKIDSVTNVEALYYLDTKELVYLNREKQYPSFNSRIYGYLDNKFLLISTVLKNDSTSQDVITREHIAICDMDGTNLRKVNIPE
jgi:hypothetical protein